MIKRYSSVGLERILHKNEAVGSSPTVAIPNNGVSFQTLLKAFRHDLGKVRKQEENVSSKTGVSFKQMLVAGGCSIY